MKKIILFICFVFLMFPLFSEVNPTVIIDTEFGKITVEIYLKAAPITANNFLKYVKKGAYKDSSFYRTVTMDNQPDNEIRIEVIQAGHNHKLMTEKYGKDYSKNSGISHEITETTGILHKDGTISMARNAPGTASFSYFICINDQPSLDFGGKRNPDGQGFAAFGKVIKGMNIVRKIQKSPSKGQNLDPVIKIKNISFMR